MVQGKSLDDADVNSLLSKADVVIAHNAGFDRPFMEARFPAFASKPWACSFKDIDWKAEGADSAKLTALAADAGLFYDAHRALMDCHALLAVVSRSAMGSQSSRLLGLISQAQRLSYKLCATGAPFASKDVLKNRGYRWDAEHRVWCCHSPDEADLGRELVWLGANVYGQSAAQVDVEVLDALTRYSVRTGRTDRRRVFGD
jgi:DNA polymerase-3 subunit epsilon